MAEPKPVYSWLSFLKEQLPFPILTVTGRKSNGDLRKSALTNIKSKNGNVYNQTGIPAHIIDKEGKSGLLMRQCTTDFKILPIQREIKKILNKGEICQQWLGMSFDEIIRMKPSQKKYIHNRFPLIELKMTRNDCLNWIKENNYPKPPRSACTFCPFRSNQEWINLRNDDAKGFEEAVVFEKSFQEKMSEVKNFRGIPYLHKSFTPLGEIDFEKEINPSDTIDMFTNECSGHCGVNL